MHLKTVKEKIMEDAAIVKGLRLGDKTAFDELYEKYHLQLYRNAFLITGDQMDAEDVLQNTFVTAWRNIKKLKNPESLKYWLFRIMTREAWKAGRSKEIPDAEIVSKADEYQWKYEDHTDPAESFSDRDRIITALHMLDIKHREVIILFYYEGMSVKEIASSLGCFEGTVKSRLNTAKRKLKTVFETTDNENIEEMEDKRDVGVI